jgi:hypothetical protein
MLVRSGVFTDVTLQTGETLLYTACARNLGKMVDFLVAHGARVDARTAPDGDKLGCGPLRSPLVPADDGAAPRGLPLFLVVI